MNSKASQPPPVTAIDQLKEHETRWRQVGRMLHQLLCSLAPPSDPAQVEAALVELRELMSSADKDRVPTLLGRLATAVQTLDANGQPHAGLATGELGGPGPVTAVGETLLLLVEQLQLGGQFSVQREELRAEIALATTLPDLRRYGEALAGLVTRQYRKLHESWLRASALLQQINAELTLLADSVQHSITSAEDVAATSLQLGELMAGELMAMDEEAEAATDIDALRSAMHARINTISTQLLAMREREFQLESMWSDHTHQLSTRVHELESLTERMGETLEQKIHQLDTDPLTGLANRRALDIRIAALCAEPAGTASLLMLDIDHFKQINDRLGHLAGDRALRIVAEQLQAGLRPGDFLARFGGEEFVAMLHAGLDEAMQVAERLRSRIERTRFRSENKPVRITVSCGIACVVEGDTPASLFERADQALYEAKKAGRNCSMVG